ncbi:hypothetical protein ASA1KI_12880 [Opitutales bacterium ASA1]|jgi:hypothetical protein|uniref:hypothetical protein n=1 Tax=Congregicoccus parvus TaxID=3081749 RepID=UPI002B31590B|nr:hypothetical protein ASA1KI_12880 [Opitutales bacterium ASA1]
MIAPTFQELLDYAEGRLPEADRSRIEASLTDADPTTRDTLAWIGAFLEQARVAPLHPLPDALEGRLRAVFTPVPRRAERPAPETETLGRRFGRILAELISEVTIAPAAAGLRSASFQRPVRHYTFGSERFDIIVNALSRPDRRFDLHGQVYARASDAFPSNASAQLLHDEREWAISVVDEHGEFRLTSVPSGRYTLVVATPDCEVQCVSFAIEP